MEREYRFGHFPLFAECAGGVFLVIGGGRVASRRVRTLMRFDFVVRVVSPAVSKEIEALSESGSVQWIKRRFEVSDLDGVSFAAACTDEREVNRLAGQMCRERGIPVSVADAPEECSFFFPAHPVVHSECRRIFSFLSGKSHNGLFPYFLSK